MRQSSNRKKYDIDYEPDKRVKPKSEKACPSRIHPVKTEFKKTSFVVWIFFIILTDLFQIYFEYYTVFRV